MRKLSETFMEALKGGVLQPILEYVQKDSTLNLEIRENQVTIYYRGGVFWRFRSSMAIASNTRATTSRENSCLPGCLGLGRLARPTRLQAGLR